MNSGGLTGPDGFTRLAEKVDTAERIGARAVELATERDAALARIARTERLIDSWERDAPGHSNPVFIGRLRECLRRDPAPVQLREGPVPEHQVGSIADLHPEQCVVCSRLAPLHGGLCCFHKYDEQPTCDACAADEPASCLTEHSPPQTECDDECSGLCGEHHWLDRPESDTRECLICGAEVAG
jgi:hypothetical protein